MTEKGREKIAISIDRRLLERVDARVDGTNVKSRSHAIELLLNQALGGTGADMRALVLCGGEGRRLRPLTYRLPKSMVEVGGKPILQRIVEWLRANGVRHLILATGHLGSEIESYFGNGESFGVEIEYAREGEPLGTAGPVNVMQEKAQGAFLVLNGDVLRAMLEAHRKSGALVTMALKSVKEAGHYGDFCNGVAPIMCTRQKTLICVYFYAIIVSQTTSASVLQRAGGTSGL